jgi:hypothetical protein
VSILNLGAILIFHAWQHWFYNKKTLKVKKKFGRKYNKKKIKASQKIGKKIHHFNKSAILNFSKKNCGTKAVLLVKKHSKIRFIEILK